MIDSLTALVEVLGSAILHSVWQVTAIGVMTWALLGLLRGARANARYLVACSALMLTLLVPLLEIATALTTQDVAPRPIVSQAVDQVPRAGEFLTIRELQLQAAPLLPWVVAAWALGAATMSLRLAFGLAWIQRLRLRSRPLADLAWQETFERLTRELAVARYVQLLTADIDGGPISAGLLRPFILVPTAMLARVPPAVIEALIAHELAHIKRHDYFVNLLQSLVETLLFYHPVVWWLSRRIRLERELIADHIATKSSVTPQRLAHALAALDSFTHSQRQLLQAADGGQLMSRIEQLIKPNALPAGGRLTFASLAVAAMLIAVLAQAQGTQVSTPAAAATPAVPAAPATPATPPAPAAPESPAEPVDPTDAEDQHDDTYALVDGKQRDGFAMSGSLRDLDAIRAAQRRFDGKFVWFRQGAATYIIQDPAVVEKIEREFATSRQHDAKMQALNAEMESHSKKVDSLVARLDELVGDMSRLDTRQESAAIEAKVEQQHELEQENRKLNERIAEVNEDERAALVARMDAIEVKRVTLDYELRQLEQKLTEKTTLPQGTQDELTALEKQIAAASKPMEPLGKQIEAIASEQAKKFQVADRVIRQLLADAALKGLAKPAPARM